MTKEETLEVQILFYLALEYAKTACPNSYKKYDWIGLYRKTLKKEPPESLVKDLESSHS